MTDNPAVRMALTSLLLPPGLFVWLILISVVAWQREAARLLAVAIAAIMGPLWHHLFFQPGEN